MAGIRGKAALLVSPDGSYEYGSKAWAERNVISVIKIGMRGRAAGLDPTVEPAIARNPQLVLQGVAMLARLKGWIVERKTSLQGRVDLSKLSPAELQSMLTGHLDQLDPASRAQIESIAAGELDITADPED